MKVKDSRLVKVSCVQRVGELGRVAIDDGAVVLGEVLPRRLVLGKVPTSGQFGFQSLAGKKMKKISLNFWLSNNMEING